MKIERFKNIDKNFGEIYFCEQCGRCSSACPVTNNNKFNIRRLIRYFELYNEKILDDLFYDFSPWSCLSCGRCNEVCLNGVNILSIVRLMRKLFPTDLVNKVPCIEACPLNLNIPKFIRLISNGEKIDALKLILDTIPIPNVLSRVCNRACELNCQRSKIDSAVSICCLKRYVSDCDYLIYNDLVTISNNTGKKVLIIGSGPAGLSAAYFLRKKGHEVTIIEKSGDIGGVLRYGIPNYRLPREALEVDLKRIINMGININVNVNISKFLSSNLNNIRYDAVFIAVGLQKSYMFELNNINILNKITYGIDFLRNINNNFLSKIYNKILIVGGGKVALDVAMSSIRIGVSEVIVVCLEKESEMFVEDSVLSIAMEEGVKFINSYGIKEILEDGNQKLVKLINCKSIFDKFGEFNPEYGTDTMEILVDDVVVSIGQCFDRSIIKDLSDIIGKNIKTKNGYLVVDSNNKIFGSNNFFAGGDVIGEISLVSYAVLSGRNAAESIDKYLGGNGICFEKFNVFEKLDDSPDCSVGSSYFKKQKQNILPKNERIKSFLEINGGLTEEEVKIECSRCLKCDLELKFFYL